MGNLAKMSFAQIQNLKTYLKNSSLTFTDEWLSACVDWVKENYNPVTEAILREQVIEQWKDVNLEEMESCCLPINLLGQRCTQLSGKYGLQINSIQDIGESAYSQWTKIKRLDNANTDVAATDSTDVANTWAPKARRCLFLNMTDGVQQVHGLELTYIPCLSLELKPGIKVLIQGPVECRRGVFQLKPANVKVIGGEVEDLVKKNSVLSILCETLHKPPDDDDNNLTAPQRPILNQPRNSNTVIVGEFPASLSDDDFPAFEDDDDIFMEIDETEILASAATSSSTSNSMNSETRRNAETQLILNNSATAFPPTRLDSRLQPSTSNSLSSNRRDFNDATQMPPPQAQQDRQVPAVSNPAGKSKKFVPPPPPRASTSTHTNSTKSIEKLSTSDTIASKPTQPLGGFKSAKTLVMSNSTKKKQLKIDGYMKPMPVVIKPPTPVKPVSNVEPQTSESRLLDRNEGIEVIDSIILDSDDDDDGALMDIIEGSFAAELERAEREQENFDRREIPVTSDQLKSSTSSYFSNTKSPPTGIVRPTSIPPKISLPIMVTKQPYVFLKLVNDNWDTLAENREVVYVKACVATVTSNIQVISGNWTLSVSINDGTGFLNCRISADILNDIIGFSPTEMKQMKATKTQEAKEKIAKGMKALTTTLVHLNAIIGIEVGLDPLILEFRDVMSHHLGALKARVAYLP